MSSRSSRITRLLVLLVSLCLPLPALLATPAFAKSRPDLKVTRVTAKPATMLAGEKLKVTATTKNVGRVRAKRSKVRYYLSSDKKRGKSDVLLGTRKVGALKKREKNRGSLSLRVPAQTKARGWFVVACADATRKVAEVKEGNNCKATGKPITVRPPGDKPPVGQPPIDQLPTGPMFPMTPDPLTVAATLQSDKAVTRPAYPFMDNTTSASAADGTKYTLVIPKDSLLGPEDITLTPVAEMPGLPLSGGLVAGVQIEPHGLMLLKPATLTITSPDAGPVSAQTAFLGHAGGEDFHLYPMDMPKPGDDKNTIRMSLTHFSTPGVGLGTPADRASVQKRVPFRSQSQVESAISEILRQERANINAGQALDPAVAVRVLGVMNQYYADVVRPALQAAEVDPELAASAIAEALAWSRQVQLLGDADNPLHQEVMQRVERILRNAMNHYWTKCVNHELKAAAKLLGIARAAALFGWSWAQEAQDKFSRCANFEVRFDSLITTSFAEQDGAGISDTTRQGRWHVASTFEVPWIGSAAGPLGFTEFSFRSRTDYLENVPDCPNRYLEVNGTTTTPGSIYAQLAFTANPREVPPPGTTPSPAPVATVLIDPGRAANLGSARPTEIYHHYSHHCYDSTWTSTGHSWLGSFANIHGTQLKFKVMPKDLVGEFLVSKNWNHTEGNGTNQDRLVEVSTLDIVHKPLP